MKKLLTLLIFCGLITACSKTKPAEITITRDGATVKVEAKHTETFEGIQSTTYSTVKLTVAEDGKVRSNEGDEWDTLDQAIEDSVRMAKAGLEATIRGLKEIDSTE